MPSSSARSRVYLRRIQGAHGGWPLFHDGAFDISASVKAYFALKMIGDSDRRRPHAPRPRGDPARAAARRAPTCSPASCWRCSASCRGARAGDAGRDHAAAEMVSVPSRQDFLLEPHRDRAAAGADGAKAARAQSARACGSTNCSSSRRESARTGAEGAAAEARRGSAFFRGVDARPARRRAAVPEAHAPARHRPRRRLRRSSGSTARTGSARFSRPWPTP